eukprot:1144337-Pelagomonas_calceolata.AAC.5
MYGSQKGNPSGVCSADQKCAAEGFGCETAVTRHLRSFVRRAMCEEGRVAKVPYRQDGTYGPPR